MSHQSRGELSAVSEPAGWRPPRWVAPFFGLAALLLVPWVVLLVVELPSAHRADHWDVAWVGFDIALAVALGATAWSIARRSAWAPTAAAVAATLLLCDAWFDIALASGHEDQVEAVLEAALVEIPLAIFLVLLARHYEHAVASVLAAFRRRP